MDKFYFSDQTIKDLLNFDSEISSEKIRVFFGFKFVIPRKFWSIWHWKALNEVVRKLSSKV